MSRITINLNDKEEKLKNMIRELLQTDGHGNPYFRRTESIVAKMILEPALKTEYEKYIKGSK